MKKCICCGKEIESGIVSILWDKNDHIKDDCGITCSECLNSMVNENNKTLNKFDKIINLYEEYIEVYKNTGDDPFTGSKINSDLCRRLKLIEIEVKINELKKELQRDE